MSNNQVVRTRERVPTGRRGRPSKSMIAAAMERPFCAYLHKICLNNRLEGHKYCIDHIMNDKTAPYRQCTFVHSITGRRCSRAAHKVDRRASPLCQYHRALRLNSNAVPTLLPEDTSRPESESLLQDLSHHKLAIEPRAPSNNTFWLPKPGLPGQAMPSNKLNKIMSKYVVQKHQSEANGQSIDTLPTMEEIAARHNNADSDTESVDNNMDFFKHAQVFTEEELTKTLRDKMMKLRRLYIEQYGHIQYILKEKRLKYIQAQRLEDELFGELYSYRNNRTSSDYAKLRAMLRYHKTFGQESLLQEQAKRRKLSRPQPAGPHPQQNRQQPQQVINEVTVQNNNNSNEPPAATSTTVTTTVSHLSASSTNTNNNLAPPPPNATNTSLNQSTSATQTTPNTIQAPAPLTTPASMAAQAAATMAAARAANPSATTVCIFSKTQYGCDKPCVPLSPYCRQHILYDPKQVLFRPCAGGVPPCVAPVISYTRKNRCWLHLQQ